MKDQQKTGKKAVSVVLGIFLVMTAIVFFILSFSVLPFVGFLLAALSIVSAIAFFVRAHRIPA